MKSIDCYTRGYYKTTVESMLYSEEVKVNCQNNKKSMLNSNAVIVKER